MHCKRQNFLLFPQSILENSWTLFISPSLASICPFCDCNYTYTKYFLFSLHASYDLICISCAFVFLVLQYVYFLLFFSSLFVYDAVPNLLFYFVINFFLIWEFLHFKISVLWGNFYFVICCLEYTNHRYFIFYLITPISVTEVTCESIHILMIIFLACLFLVLNIR